MLLCLVAVALEERSPARADLIDLLSSHGKIRRLTAAAGISDPRVTTGHHGERCDKRDQYIADTVGRLATKDVPPALTVENFLAILLFVVFCRILSPTQVCFRVAGQGRSG